MSREKFEEFYKGKAPWDIPEAQPAIVALEESGGIAGAVLDAGCGTGENATYPASRGHEVVGRVSTRHPGVGRGVVVRGDASRRALRNLL